MHLHQKQKADEGTFAVFKRLKSKKGREEKSIVFLNLLNLDPHRHCDCTFSISLLKFPNRVLINYFKVARLI